MPCAKCKEYFRQAAELSERLKDLVQKGQMDCENDRCLIVYGVILDSAFGIQNEALKRMKEIDAGASCHYGDEVEIPLNAEFGVNKTI